MSSLQRLSFACLIWLSAVSPVFSGPVLLNRPVKDASGESRAIVAVAFSTDGKFLAWAEPSRARLWDLKTGKAKFSWDMKEISALAYASDGRTLALAGSEGVVLLVDPVKGTELHRLKAHKGGVKALAFAPDNVTLVSGVV